MQKSEINILETTTLQNELYNYVKKVKHIKEKYKNYSEQSLVQVVGYFKKISEVEHEKGKDVVFFTQQEMIEMFEHNRWVSPSVINNKQSLIREWMREYRKYGYPDWKEVDIRGSIDLITKENISGDLVYEAEWFKSLDDMQDCIDEILDLYVGSDNKEYNTCIAAMYLAWLGIDCKEIIQIIKADVFRIENKIYLPLSEIYLEVDEKMMEFFVDYIDSDGYYSERMGSQIVMKYKDSPYLIRSNKKEYLSENNIRSNLARFSDIYEETGKSRRFKYDKIQLSGRFSRLLEYEKEHGELTTKDAQIFEDQFRESFTKNGLLTQKFYYLLKDFKQFKEFFYNN